jgi:hypothetical protein
MNRTLLSLLAAGALAGAVVPALAQGSRPADWQPLRARQAEVSQRIELGARSGDLSDLAARDLRNQFKGLINLEDTYRQTGLTLNQRADLQARYDTLIARIKVNSAGAVVEDDVRPAGAVVVRKSVVPAPPAPAAVIVEEDDDD